jgi:hypothetical protein
MSGRHRPQLTELHHAVIVNAADRKDFVSKIR